MRCILEGLLSEMLSVFPTLTADCFCDLFITVDGFSEPVLAKVCSSFIAPINFCKLSVAELGPSAVLEIGVD